ncbi:MAG: hypothetical protein JO266_15585 [Acidobacteria bacterium]|nr:hypothetical protein [Acidobacteriota bacterium]MBV8893366.1 hypothetical protein [Acidobacteriota bacterium]
MQSANFDNLGVAPTYRALYLGYAALDASSSTYRIAQYMVAAVPHAY